METYLLFRGVKPNGDPECMAIHPDEFEVQSDGYAPPDGHKPQPLDFFIPGTTDIEKIGEIQITGDVHLLNTYFSVTF